MGMSDFYGPADRNESIATIHAAHRFRQRQAAFGELTGIIEATLRYKLGRMEFERLLVRAAKVPELGRVRVQLEYTPRDARRRDTDNLVATLKAV